MRWATDAENECNRGRTRNNTCGYKGVAFHKPLNKYRAQIRINCKTKHLGYFDTPEDASKAYETKAKEIHKEFYYKK